MTFSKIASFLKKRADKRALALVAVLLVGAACVAAYLLSQPRSYTIKLTDDGFAPADITIHKGDTVVFVNERDTYFWPASNLHPTHALYTEFDAKKPLPPKSSWSFTFDRVGLWGFHDHLAPLFLGTIRVIGSDEPLFQVSVKEDCSSYESQNERMECWSQQIKKAFNDAGVEGGFNIFTTLYNTQPEFAADCHTYTHILGQLAYEAYRAGDDFSVTDQVAYCSYGFFHGFMEALAFETGNYEGARDFCDYIDKQLGNGLSTVGPCIHGIGHGITDGTDPRTQGDARKLIEPGIRVCADVTRTEYEDMICATGVFNSLGELYLGNPNSTLIDPNDMYAICRIQPEEFLKRACYEDLKIVAYALGDSDLKKAIGYVERSPDDEQYKEWAIENLALYHVYNVNENDYGDSIAACHSLADDGLRIYCLRGLSSGFINSGTPDKEYIRALDFCSSDLLYDSERGICYDRMLQAAYNRYRPDLFHTICSMVPAKYHDGVISGRNYCMEEDNAARP